MMHNFGLVVIGAHFGVWLKDQINSVNNEKILLVEPVPYNYNRLKEDFKNNKNIHICTNAVFSENKIRKFYYVNENSIPKLGKHWASGIGSFNKNHILEHKTKRFKIEDHDIVEIDIEFITFDSLIKKYLIKSIDRLQIDVEGAEYEILKSIDFKAIEIKSIQFESKHFDGTFKEGPKLEEIKQKLKSEGYNLNQIDNENIIANK
ncbi:FkbM family methyltransferase [Candidatus Pelagibacter communis]|uniref:FkbM family methyltransferase n=1 Tax=Pelagibacter ubique TaxID=198252 RepID=UPI00092CE3DA|nr:FkbM family methyltransferase [Candidatus Pelagibacter ubique]